MSQQERLSNDEFLNRLATLFAETHSVAHGSIYLTQKPAASSSISTDAAIDTSSPSPAPGQILVRATNGLSKEHRLSKTGAPGAKSRAKSAKQVKEHTRPKVKLATLVDSAELDSFYTRYAEVCKKGMEGLRKRDKKKAKEKAKAKKKGKGGPAGGGGSAAPGTKIGS